MAVNRGKIAIVNDMTDESRFEQVAQRIAPDGRLRRTWPLAGGISAQMTGLEVEDGHGTRRKLVVRRPGEATLRIRPSAIEDEYRLLQAARSQRLAVPAPLLFDPRGELFPTPFLVTEYIEGEINFAPVDMEDYVSQLADHLAAIHRVNAAAVDLSFLPQPAGEFPEFSKMGLNQLDLPFDPSLVVRLIQAAWPLPQRNTPRLLHGDYWPGNVLWQGNRLAAVIDWEDAAFGDPLMDLGGCRMELAWICGMEAMEGFTRQYRRRRMDLDETDLPYWELAAALRMAAWAFPDLTETAAFFAPFNRTDITPQTIRETMRRFVERALSQI